jgi:hypothetical protein
MTADVLGLLAGLAGLGGLISVLINILKTVGVVQDGTAPQWVQGFNLVAFVAVSIVYFLNVQVDWMWIDGILVFATTFLGFVVQLLGSEATYSVIKGIPIIGYSHS